MYGAQYLVAFCVAPEKVNPSPPAHQTENKNHQGEKLTSKQNNRITIVQEAVGNQENPHQASNSPMTGLSTMVWERVKEKEKVHRQR